MFLELWNSTQGPQGFTSSLKFQFENEAFLIFWKVFWSFFVTKFHIGTYNLMLFFGEFHGILLDCKGFHDFKKFEDLWSRQTMHCGLLHYPGEEVMICFSERLGHLCNIVG